MKILQISFHIKSNYFLKTIFLNSNFNTLNTLRKYLYQIHAILFQIFIDSSNQRRFINNDKIKINKFNITHDNQNDLND